MSCYCFASPLKLGGILFGGLGLPDDCWCLTSISTRPIGCARSTDANLSDDKFLCSPLTPPDRFGRLTGIRTLGEIKHLPQELYAILN